MKKKKNVLELRPTQFAVGMLEVEEKLKIVRQFNKKQVRNYIESTPVPVVISPRKHLYVMDHHHFLRVCYLVGIKKVKVAVVKDLSASKLSYTQFWKWMVKHRDVYLFCQFGEGPRNPLYLPGDVRTMADDPYRSLAWYVRKAGAFRSSDRIYAEFRWANFFRENGLLDKVGPFGMEEALVKAVKLAQSPAAKHLPGYGKLNLQEISQAEKTAKKKGAAIKTKRPY